MKRISLAFFMLFSITTFSQFNSINYKASIRSAGGVVVSNSAVTVQFRILEGVAQTNVYQETHTPTTDANGIVILNIGEGSVNNGEFATIDWASDDHFLNTWIDTGTGLTNMGVTAFSTVPYAIQTQHALTASSYAETDPSVPVGNTSGEMQYWDGSDWVLVPATLNEGATLQMIIGIPTWVDPIEERFGSSVVEVDAISTISDNNILISGMTLSPEIGTYVAFFNGQHKTGLLNRPFTSAQGVIDMDMICQDLKAIPATGTHALVFGNGETLQPGVYDITGAVSIAGTLELDGGTAVDPVFIIRSTGAFTSGAGTEVVLLGNAEARNIYWVSDVALSTGASSIMKGAMVSLAGAITLGAGTDIEGRMFTKAGALGVAANCILTVPSGVSHVNLGVLSLFAMFTSAGAVSDDVTSMITGDVGSALGAIAILGTHIGEIYPAGSASNSETIATYSIYQDGVEIGNSRRTINSLNSVVSLQTMITVSTIGGVIEVHWKVENGEAILDNRILSLIRSGN
jgi:hypothetical protein